jgi:hypothetical protein
MMTARLLALALLLSTCGDDGPLECKKPVDCVAQMGANTCKIVGGHGRCVIGCAMTETADSCPISYRCGGRADDGTTFCTAK